MNKKKILSLSLFAGVSLAFTGCAGEEEDLFSSSAAERLTTATAEYTDRLSDMGGKWTMEYYPTNGDEAPQGLGYLLLLDFDADRSVKVAMNNNFTGNRYKEDVSVWEMIADNGPVLTFNSYNECLHAFSDPADIGFTTGSLNDETGLGAEGDYEFMVLSLDDKAAEGMLKGKKRGVYDRIIRLPEDTGFEEYITDVQAFHNTIFPVSAPNYAQLNFGGETFRIDEGNGGMPNIYRLGTDAIVNESRRPFLITKHDGVYRLRFRDEMTAADGSKAQEFLYDEESQTFNATGNSGATITGPDATTFLFDNKWQWSRTSEMSESMAKICNDMRADFSALKLTLQNMRLIRQDETTMAFTVSYRPQGSPQTTVTYLFDIAAEDGAVRLTYREPVITGSVNGQAVLDAVKSLGDMLAALSDTFVAEPTGSKFDLTSVRIKSAGPEEKWITVTYY